MLLPQPHCPTKVEKTKTGSGLQLLEGLLATGCSHGPSAVCLVSVDGASKPTGVWREEDQGQSDNIQWEEISAWVCPNCLDIKFLSTKSSIFSTNH